MNKVVVIGNLTRDVETRTTQGGQTIGKIGLALTRKFKGQDGSVKEEVCFVDCKMFGGQADNAMKYLAKGSKVAIGGRLFQEQWVDKQGAKHSKIVIIAETIEFLTPKKNIEQQEGANQALEDNGIPF